MKTKKLVRLFGKSVDREARRRSEEEAALGKLLEQLRGKAEKLAAEARDEDDPDKVAKREKKLALIAAQLEKGEQILQTRQEEQRPSRKRK